MYRLVLPWRRGRRAHKHGPLQPTSFLRTSAARNASAPGPSRALSESSFSSTNELPGHNAVSRCTLNGEAHG